MKKMNRFLLIFMSLLFLTSFSVLIMDFSFAKGSDEHYIEVLVQEGDTLWDIAKVHNPDNIDLRKLIYEISEINQLSEKQYIYPGQIIKIPEI